MLVAQSASLEFEDLLGLDPMEYGDALHVQRRIHEEVALELRPSTVIFLQHQPVFTAGKRTESHERPVSLTPVIDVDRGGKITWHGPGQLVCYPIIKLRRSSELVGYVRELEGGIIEALGDFHITGGRVTGRSGVWIERSRKIAAIGIRVAQGVTMHGFAINANCSLDAFDEIIPCGINDAQVTSMTKETSREISVTELAPIVMKKMRPILEGLI